MTKIIDFPPAAPRATKGLKPKSHCNALPVDWSQIKLERCQGKTREAVALKHGVKTETIRKREQRELWPIIDRARRELGLSQRLSQKEENRELKAETEANMTHIALNHPVLMAEYLAQKRDQMLSQDLLQAPDNWKNANTLDTMLRRAAGLDKPQTQVQVNLWQGGQSVPVQTFDVESA